jgi:pimeloyl-ACP methyl ester carboxylesterase
VTAVAANERALGVGGLRITVREAGDGPPVCLINGIGANVKMLANFQDALLGHRTVAFDSPGAGSSSTPTRLPSVRYLARVTAQLLSELGHEHVDVVGFSYGGGVAQQLARDHPGLVRRLVLASTSCGFGGVLGHPAAVAAIMTPLRYYSPVIHSLSSRWMGQGRASLDPTIVAAQGQARLSAPPSPVGYTWQVLAGLAWTSWSWLPEIEQAVLVLAGGEDRLIPPANSALLAARLPRARLIVMPDEDHHLLADPSPRLVADILEFLDADHVNDSKTWQSAVELSESDPALRNWTRARSTSAALSAMCRSFLS